MPKINIIVSVVLVMLSFIGCQKDEKITGGMHVEGQLYIKYKDKAGQNLLLTSTPGYYDLRKIKLYFVEKGVKKLFSLPFPNDYQGIEKRGSPEDPELIVTTNVGYKGDIIKEDSEETISHMTSILEMENSNQVEKLQDTIRLELHERAYHIWIQKVWYNQKLVYDLSGKIGGPAAAQFTIER